MRRLAGPLLALSLAACSEATINVAPPMDAFYYPVGLALVPSASASGGEALLVSSSDIDLRYGPEDGSTLLSVDPDDSLLKTNGALDVLGGVRIGTYAGPVAVASADTCPGYGGRQALVASRLGRRLSRIPLDADGAPQSCGGGDCSVPLEPQMLDPFAVAVACRADATRPSAYVAYLSSPKLGAVPAGTAWLSELDLEDATRPLRTISMGTTGPVVDMAYDAGTDRLYAVGRFAGLVAPLYVLDLPSCRLPHAGDTTVCPTPVVHVIDLFALQRGAELTSIALSNPVAGVPRRAYVTAALYDADQAALTGVRPVDIGGVLMVLDLLDDASGSPSARLVQVIDAGVGTGQVKVLPARPGQRDLVVWANGTAGTLTLYDDEVGAVSRVLALNQQTGEPLVGREPFGLAVSDRGATARVYVSAFNSSIVSAIDVPLDSPGSAVPVGRIGKERPL